MDLNFAATWSANLNGSPASMSARWAVIDGIVTLTGDVGSFSEK
jgi:hypothetical protein